MELIKIEQGLQPESDAIPIRQEVFIEEQGFQNEFDTIDQKAYHAICYLDDVPVATGRTFPSPENKKVYVIGRVAVRKPFRKLHLGGKIINALEQEAKKHHAEKIELSSQVQAKGFYEKLGYSSDGGVYYDEHCPHIKMKKSL